MSTDQLAAPQTGNKSAFYAEAVEKLIAEGLSVGEAAKRVAEANGVTQGNVQASLYRERRKAGKPSSRPARVRSYARTPRSSVTQVPGELAPLLDALKRDRESFASNVDAVIKWVEGQRQSIDAERERAYQDTVEKIRAAAGL